MKKIIISVVFVLTAVISFAQVQVNSESSAHLAFKGVPIDGTLHEYVLKMEKNGFTHLGTEEGIAMLKGDFASYKNCIVGVATLKQKDLVSSIKVIFPECDTWSYLSSNYFSLKEMLTEKYGEPSDCVEKFDGI
jgi:phosphatidylserine synthase